MSETKLSTDADDVILLVQNLARERDAARAEVSRLKAELAKAERERDHWLQALGSKVPVRDAVLAIDAAEIERLRQLGRGARWGK